MLDICSILMRHGSGFRYSLLAYRDLLTVELPFFEAVVRPTRDSKASANLADSILSLRIPKENQQRMILARHAVFELFVPRLSPALVPQPHQLLVVAPCQPIQQTLSPQFLAA
jgi:hypothetical protein